jgi:heme/copper-type cytochrome/quinol oxidase subunit 4
MVMLCVVCAWHAVIAVCPTDVAQQWDNTALISLAVIYTVFHLFFFCWMYFVVSRRKRNFGQ